MVHIICLLQSDSVTSHFLERRKEKYSVSTGTESASETWMILDSVLNNQTLVGSLEAPAVLVTKLKSWGHERASMYYDPEYDGQSNFPAAKKQLERLKIWEGRLTNELMPVLRESWGVGSVAANASIAHIWAHLLCLSSLSSVLDKSDIFLLADSAHLFSFQRRSQKLCFSSSATLHHSVKFLSSFVAVPFWSCNTPWPLEAPLIQSLTFDPPSHLLCFSRSGHWQARDMSGSSSHLWR